MNITTTHKPQRAREFRAKKIVAKMSAEWEILRKAEVRQRAAKKKMLQRDRRLGESPATDDFFISYFANHGEESFGLIKTIFSEGFTKESTIALDIIEKNFSEDYIAEKLWAMLSLEEECLAEDSEIIVKDAIPPTLLIMLHDLHPKTVKRFFQSLSLIDRQDVTELVKLCESVILERSQTVLPFPSQQ